MKIGILTSHPIQYQVPWFRALAKQCDLTVYFAHQPDAHEQGKGFGQAFSWDVDLLSGYRSEFLPNLASNPDTGKFGGCDTPGVAGRIQQEAFTAFIVTGWYLKCFWQAILACRRLKIPVLVRGDSQLATPRSKLKIVLKEVAYRALLKSFDGFLTVGQRNREYLRHYGVPENRLFSAPHFIDNEKFGKLAREAMIQRPVVRAGWGASPEQLVVLYVGKFIGEKGLPILLKGFAAADAAFPGLFKMVFVGSGPLEDECRQLASTLGLAPVFAGFKNQGQLPACYVGADVLILASVSETWGLVVNEAMACGIPAIVSDACGCAPDLIEEAETGYVFPSGDASKLAARLVDWAKKTKAGHSWKAALQQKLDAYSVDSCTRGTLLAVEKSVKRAR